MVYCALSKCVGICHFNVLFGIFDVRKIFLGVGKMTPTRSFLAFQILLDTSKNSSVLCNMQLKFNDERG
jgi:hypothetical protein